MKNLILFTFLLASLALDLQATTHLPINSVSSLKEFISDGQEKGYFPKTVLIPGYGVKKLEEVDIDFRTLINWNIDSRCPNREDQIILALGNDGHSIVCNTGNTAGIMGSGNDWVNDATGNDIYYPGAGNDIINTGSGNDILIFDAYWGHDKVTVRSNKVITTNILGYDGSYPWKYNTFIIFGKDIRRSDIVWRGKTLYNIVTNDSIELNTKQVNILFASDPDNNSLEVPDQKQANLASLQAVSITKDKDYLYLANGNYGFFIVDIRDLSNPAIISKTVLPGFVNQIIIKNNVAYIPQSDYSRSGKRGWVSIIDISNKTAPKLLKNLKFGNNIRSIALHNNLIYIPDTHSSNQARRHLHIYDINKPEKPVKLSTTKLNTPVSKIFYFDHKIYVSSRLRKIVTIDVSDHQKPTILTNAPLSEQRSYDLSLKKDLLVNTYSAHELRIYRMKNHQTPQLICDIKTIPDGKGEVLSTHPNSLIIIDKLIYKAEGTEGFTIIDSSTCKVVNSIPKRTSLSTNRIIKIDNTIVSFNANKPGVSYPLQQDMIHQQKSITDSRSTLFSETAELSKDQLQTLLYKATMNENLQEIDKLSKLGANPNRHGHERVSPIEIAARVGHISVLERLLINGGKATKKSMFLAALKEQIGVMKLLEKYGMPVTVKDDEGCTTLHYIASDGSVDMVKYLLQQGVAYNATCRKGETPLTWANYGNNCQVMYYLQSLYPLSNKKIRNAKCDLQKIDTLLEYKAEPKKTFTSNKPLHTNMKIKAKQEGEKVKIKFLLKHPMVTPNKARKRNISGNYIDHVSLEIDGNLLFEMSNSHYLSKNPMIAVNLKYDNIAAHAKITASDNNGAIWSKKISIKHSSTPFKTKVIQPKMDEYDFWQKLPSLWEAKSIPEAAKVLYGDILYHEGDFDIQVPDVVANGVRIPLAIKSNIDLESIAILTDANPLPIIAVFNIPKEQKVDYELRFRVQQTGSNKMIVIAKGRDGRYYKTVKTYKVAGSPTCDGS